MPVAFRCALLVVAVLSLGCPGSPAGPGKPGGGIDSRDQWLGTFAVYPGARRLCSQHVTANVMHIVWTAYATSDDLAKVMAFYAGAPGAEKTDRGLTVRGPKGALLTVHDASAKGYPTCSEKPGSGDRTVLIVAQSTGGR